MDCNEARKLILAGERERGDLGRHLAQCPACAVLAEQGGALGRKLCHADEPSPQPPAELLAALQQEVAAERGPRGRLRALSTPTRVLLGVAAALAVLLSGLLALRPDVAHYPLWRLLPELGLLTAVLAAAGWLWLRPLHRPPLPGWVALLVVLLALLLPLVQALLPPAHVEPASMAGTGADLVPRALACFLHGTLLGLPVALFVALLGRGGPRLLRLAVLPAAVGALSGLVGLHLHCPLTSPAHLLAGHAPIVAVLLLLALVLARVRR